VTRTIDRAALEEALRVPVEGTRTADLFPPGLAVRRYEGKVRDNYGLPDGRRFLVTTDRVSAFDRVLGTLPLKGQLLTRLAVFWFEASREVAPNHLLGMPDPNVIEAIDCDPLPVEMVVRGYLTGVTSTSVWTHYAAGAREFCGHRLPDGLRKNEPLPAPILTPSTKAAKGGHDVSASRAEILAEGRISAAEFDAAADMAMALFAFGQRHCAGRGLVLVDTKYELGRTSDGRIVVIDELHTPDSSRFWYAGSYEARLSRGEEPESFDKEYLRRWLVASGFTGDGPAPELPDDVRVEASRRYAEAYEAIVGAPLEVDLEPPLARMKRNLGGRLGPSSRGAAAAAPSGATPGKGEP
jgi:phosphoribosylaminoimidazole-succinocarboxamide synthase